MNRGAGHEKTDEETRPRRALDRLTPAARPKQAPGAATSSSLPSVKQGKPGESNAAPSSEVKSRGAARSRTVLHVWAGRLRYYGVALLLVALGAMIRIALTRWMGPGIPTYISFSPFVMLAALIGGWGPGLLATLATALVVSYWLLPPSGVFKVASTPDAVGLVFFCIMGIFISIVAGLYHRMRGHLHELVVARTLALSQANEQLREQAEELNAANEELHQNEQALRESEEKYRRIVETATEAIVMADAEARTIFANARWSEIFGYSLEEARHMTHFDLVFPEDMAAMKARWEARKRGQKESYEFRMRRKDGSPVWVLIGVAPRLSPEGQFLGTLVMITDITKRKRAEESLLDLTRTLETKVAQRTAELEHRTRQLQKLTLEMSEAEDRERKRLAEILHDDLQQIIAAAKFHLSVMRSRVKDDASLAAIGEQVDQMLKEAVEKSRGLSHELSPAALYGDFAEALDVLAKQMQTKHGLAVHVHATGQVHPQSDASRAFLYRTAQELLFNAVKHAQVKEAEIRIRQRGHYLCLLVSDRGRGFDPQELQEAAGFGLLSIRERVELLGGRMKIKSAKGKGSTFFIIVPDGEAGAVE